MAKDIELDKATQEEIARELARENGPSKTNWEDNPEPPKRKKKKRTFSSFVRGFGQKQQGLESRFHKFGKKKYKHVGIRRLFTQLAPGLPPEAQSYPSYNTKEEMKVIKRQKALMKARAKLQRMRGQQRPQPQQHYNDVRMQESLARQREQAQQTNPLNAPNMVQSQNIQSQNLFSAENRFDIMHGPQVMRENPQTNILRPSQNNILRTENNILRGKYSLRW